MKAVAPEVHSLQQKFLATRKFLSEALINKERLSALVTPDEHQQRTKSGCRMIGDGVGDSQRNGSATNEDTD